MSLYMDDNGNMRDGNVEHWMHELAVWATPRLILWSVMGLLATSLVRHRLLRTSPVGKPRSLLASMASLGAAILPSIAIAVTGLNWNPLLVFPVTYLAIMVPTTTMIWGCPQKRAWLAEILCMLVWVLLLATVFVVPPHPPSMF